MSWSFGLLGEPRQSIVAERHFPCHRLPGGLHENLHCFHVRSKSCEVGWGLETSTVPTSCSFWKRLTSILTSTRAGKCSQPVRRGRSGCVPGTLSCKLWSVTTAAKAPAPGRKTGWKALLRPITQKHKSPQSRATSLATEKLPMIITQTEGLNDPGHLPFLFVGALVGR